MTESVFSSGRLPAEVMGYPLARRREFLLRAQGSPLKTPIVFRGERVHLPEVRVSIGLPKYRLANGRTASLQEEFLAAHPDLTDNFFTRDLESADSQAAQHSILRLLASEAGLLPFFKKEENKQVDVIILDENGFVVNGNRRLCVWRDLFQGDRSKYGHFEYINAVVLPHADESDIELLERQLQLDPELKADYSWHAFAFMVRRKIAAGLDEATIASQYGRREKDIKTILQMLEYATRYLDSRGIHSHWSKVTSSDYAFRQMVNQKAKLDSTADKLLFETMSFLMIDDETIAGDRLYKTIQNIKEFMTPICSKLREAFPQAAPTQDDPLSDPDEPGARQAEETALLATAISNDDNRQRAREIIAETIEIQQAVTREAQSINYLLRQVTQSRESLANAWTAGTAVPDVNTEGLLTHLDTINALAAQIRQWHEERQARNTSR